MSRLVYAYVLGTSEPAIKNRKVEGVTDCILVMLELIHINC